MRICKICRHPQRQAIEADITQRVTSAQIVERYAGLTVKAVERHRREQCNRTAQIRERLRERQEVSWAEEEGS